MTLMADVFLKLRTLKTVFRYMSIKHRFRAPSTGNMVKEPKHCCNLNRSRFSLVKDHFEGN